MFRLYIHHLGPLVDMEARFSHQIARRQGSRIVFQPWGGSLKRQLLRQKLDTDISPSLRIHSKEVRTTGQVVKE